MPGGFWDRLRALPAGRRALIAVAGPPGAGKSLFADGLASALDARAPGTCAVLGMDGFHFDDMVLEQRGWRDRKGAPHTFDVGGLASTLDRLRCDREDEIALPVFDRALEIARAGARLVPGSVRTVLVEGNYLLLDRAPWDALAGYFDVTLMLHAPEEVLRARLERRWADLPAEVARAKVEANDLPNARTVLTGSRAADFDVDATSAFSFPPDSA